jgi:hypothetical protein
VAVEIPQSISDAGNIVLADDINASALVEYDMKYSDIPINGNAAWQAVLSKEITFRTAKDFLYAISGGSADAAGPAAWQHAQLAFGFGGSPLLAAPKAVFSVHQTPVWNSGTTIIAIGGASLSATFPYTTTLQLLFHGSSSGGSYARLRYCWMETRMFKR